LRLDVPDIITFGEMLIDFAPTVSGVSLQRYLLHGLLAGSVKG